MARSKFVFVFVFLGEYNKNGSFKWLLTEKSLGPLGVKWNKNNIGKNLPQRCWGYIEVWEL